jgi:predicted RNA binding protein YcfA (HicA-like mRNA interferase family)
MPKLPRASGAEAIRALERLGFTQVRQRGSHVVLKRVGPEKLPGALFHCIRNWRPERSAES